MSHAWSAESVPSSRWIVFELLPAWGTLHSVCMCVYGGVSAAAGVRSWVRGAVCLQCQQLEGLKWVDVSCSDWSGAVGAHVSVVPGAGAREAWVPAAGLGPWAGGPVWLGASEWGDPTEWNQVSAPGVGLGIGGMWVHSASKWSERGCASECVSTPVKVKLG